MGARRTKSVTVGAVLAAAAICTFAALNRPHQAAAGQRWSTQRLIEHVQTQPVHLARLIESGGQVVEEGGRGAGRWARLRLPDGSLCNVYLDDDRRVDTVLGEHDPRGFWHDAVPAPQYP
jgi:hypothetical protein